MKDQVETPGTVPHCRPRTIDALPHFDKHPRVKKFLLPALLLSGFATCFSSCAAEPVRREWKVGEFTREALVYVPASAKTTPAPVVFAFHGHGGSMHNAARMFAYHKSWPEAIVVYMQGLNTPGILTDLEGRLPGWQHNPGDQGDRDLNFFDAVLKSLKADYQVDAKRVYATGHSNGGAFTYLLWAARGDQFAAMAPCAATAGPGTLRSLKPKPVLHLAGENDPLVKYQWQTATIDALRRLNQGGEGKPWQKQCTIYESKIGAPVVAFIHPGGHNFPADAATVIVKFFREH